MVLVAVFITTKYSMTGSFSRFVIQISNELKNLQKNIKVATYLHGS